MPANASSTVTPVYTDLQLTAASTAARTAGVPVQLVRNVTGYKYGNGATAADFTYTAGQLHNWYGTFYKKNGDALVAWRQAAAQEMPGATSQELVTASSLISTAINDTISAPIVGLGVGLGTFGGGIATDISGVDSFASGVGDSTDVADIPADTAATTDSAASDAATKSAAASSAAVTAVKAAGLAGLLGASGGWTELAVRILEGLAGFALVMLGLQALTGTGDGNPVSAARTVGKRAGMMAAL
jgi:hypothetical protein